jgi:DNA-binding PadR family transcriptional regulator
MQVRFGVLALLLLGDGYGQQLAREFERRTDRALNSGQVSATLERLARDGLVTDAGEDAAGRRRVALSMAGRDALDAWVRSGDDPDSGAVLALLASVDGELALEYARSRSQALATARGDGPSFDPAPADDGAVAHARWRRSLTEDRAARLDAAEAAWLGEAIRTLRREPAQVEMPLAAQPRRGRPQRFD